MKLFVIVFTITGLVGSLAHLSFLASSEYPRFTKWTRGQEVVVGVLGNAGIFLWGLILLLMK